MNIVSKRKKLLLVGILAVIIIGAVGAYLYLYPAEEEVSHTVAAPKVQPAVAAPKVEQATAKPVAPPPVATPVATTVAAPAPAVQPSIKPSKSIKTADQRPARSKTADLRDCLKLETNVAIAKCAGE